MNLTRINSLTRRQFEKVLEKEGHTIKDYYSDKEYRVFFRRTPRSTSPSSSIRMFYRQDEGLSIGSTIVISNETYIIYSQDALESDAYFTSVANRCDTTFRAVANEESVEVPVVLLQDKYTISRGQVSAVAGNLIVYGQDNDYTRAIEVNDSYYKFGNYYKIQNRFFTNGIAYIYMEQAEEPFGEYNIEYVGETSFGLNETTTYQMNFIVTQGGAVLDPQPTLTYLSSNVSVANIDSNGLLSLVSTGIAIITAIDSEHNISKDVEITIASAAPDHTFTITTYTNPSLGYPEWKISSGGSNDKIFTLHSFDRNGVEDTSTYLLDGTHSIHCDAGDWNNHITWYNRANANEKKGVLSYDISYVGNWIRVYGTLDGDNVAYVDVKVTRL